MAAVVAAVGGFWHCSSLVGEEDPSLRALQRQPVALVLSASGDRLYVANGRSGSISVLDLQQQQVIGETIVASRLSDMVGTPDGRLLATDPSQHQLLVLAADGETLEVTHRVDVASHPVSVVVSGDGQWCSVASLWSRRLTFVQFPANPAESPSMTRMLDLPFAPRTQSLVRGDSMLVVADAFGGQLGIVELGEECRLTVRQLEMHNVRGLSSSSDGQTLIVAHQRVNSAAPTQRTEVHWGRLISNDASWLSIESILDAASDPYAGGYLRPIGRERSGGGDPAGVAVAPDGRVVVALGGVGEVALHSPRGGYARVPVGRRPTAVIAHPDAQRVYIANTDEDSVSVVHLGRRGEVARISLGPRPDLSRVQRGEQLFYDATLSHDGWMSCHSCHTDGHSSGQLNDNLGDESFGAPKRVLSLLGVRDTAPYAWNGSSGDLEFQIRKSIRKTMQADYSNRRNISVDVDALAAYLRSLEPPPSLRAARSTIDADAAVRGREIFERNGCTQCHAPPLFTTAETYNVGLVDEHGHALFNPPSLRGVSQRDTLFHDSRAPSLENVIVEFRHRIRHELSPQEVRDLLEFLRSL